LIGTNNNNASIQAFEYIHGGKNITVFANTLTRKAHQQGDYRYAANAIYLKMLGDDYVEAPPTVTPPPSTGGNWSSGGSNFRPGGQPAVTPGQPGETPEQPGGPELAVFKYPLIKPTAPLGSTVTGAKTSNKLILGEEEKVFPAVNIQNYNYIKLRDLAMILNGTEKQFSVGYNAATRTVTLTSGGTYTPLGDELTDRLADPVSGFVSSQRILLDAKLVEVLAYNILDYNYFRLRDLAIMFDFNIKFDEETSVITLILEEPYEE
jgi:hypothetical protein